MTSDDGTVWLSGEPRGTGSFAGDCRAVFGILALPPMADRAPAGQMPSAARRPKRRRGDDARRGAPRASGFCASCRAVYAALTAEFSRFVRVEALVLDAAELVPGLVPTRAQVQPMPARYSATRTARKSTRAYCSHMSWPTRARPLHLCHAMLLPRPETREHLPRLQRDGARRTRRPPPSSASGRATVVDMRNPRFLNAEDDGMLDAIGDRASISRSWTGAARSPCCAAATWRIRNIAGRRIFGAGINLTHLYHGRIPFLWFLRRDLGSVHKIFRGARARRTRLPDDVLGATSEKPWIAAVDGFAIGGGCQILLVMDYVLAARDAYLTCPRARRASFPAPPICACRASPASASPAS